MHSGGQGAQPPREGHSVGMRALAFRIGDIPVKVDPTFWIIMGLLGLNRAAAGGGFDVVLIVEWIVLGFLGILVHELGHAVAFRAFGRPPSVVLYGMGGLTSAPGGLSPGRRLVTTLAGPGVGLALGAAVLLLQGTGLWDLPRFEGFTAGELVVGSLGGAPGQMALPEIVFLDLLFINIWWGVLNLVPLHPLDGGQSLEAFLELVGVRRAAVITSAVGVAVAAAGAVLGARSNQVFLVIIMLFLGLANVRRLGALLRPRPAEPPAGAAPVGLSPQLQHTLTLAEQALRQDRPDEAVELLRQEHAYRPSPQSARTYVAVLARTRRLAEVEALVHEQSHLMDAQTLAAAAAALVAGGHNEAGLRAAEAAWTADRSGDWTPAVTAAAARAGMRDVDGALRWLFMAADRGWDDRRRLESDPVFAEVRVDPRLGDLLARMGV